MEPIYLDLHIHTSENPEELSDNYDVDTLIKNIKLKSENSNFLISLTDHNTINKKVYLKAITKTKNLLLGAELHIQNYPNTDPYHCHIYFNEQVITEDVIDNINKILDFLYPKKVIDKKTEVPNLEKIVRNFEKYDFMLLPHGGQSHSTFNKSIPKGIEFDTSIERAVYYNNFDGFTARSNTRLEETIDYFKKLGINEFTNLITCTDNYDPDKYPNSRSSKAEMFIPTWMLASPTFDGLRLSLSESSRLVYSDKKPKLWTEFIEEVHLKNENIDIDVKLTPGLNVVIGGSSSGKSLFVDSLYRKINTSEGFDKSFYKKYGVQDIDVINPSKIIPHYLDQNYIMKVVDSDNDKNHIENIDIIKKVFPGDKGDEVKIQSGLAKFKNDLNTLVNAVKTLDIENKNLTKIATLSRLVTNKDVSDNILSYFIPSPELEEKTVYEKHEKERHIDTLDEIEEYLSNNPFIKHNKSLIKNIKAEIEEIYYFSELESKIKGIIIKHKDLLDENLRISDAEQQTKKQDFEKLLKTIEKYSKALDVFNSTLEEILKCSIKFDSKHKEYLGHKLYIENNFTLDKEKFLEVVNKYLKTENKINDYNDFKFESLFELNFKKKTPVVKNYEDFATKIYNDFESLNKKTYKITTRDGRDFESLSAGWKTSVILDLILGYEEDIAPLIIDQPEDNLAPGYINKDLIHNIKKIKSKKQIIIVSHNATIPMLGDAQNVILCQNDNDKIIIRSDKLEGRIKDKSMVDYIAELTDGGKQSIKKRVKKYNLKNYRE